MVALSVGVGLDRDRRYQSYRVSCLFTEESCGRHARDVWSTPIQGTAEFRFPGDVTFAPHAGFKVPVSWDECTRWNGERNVRCVPLLTPYVGVAIQFSRRLGRTRRTSGDPYSASSHP